MVQNQVAKTLLRKKKDPQNWKWCSYCKTIHRVEAFNRNVYSSTGFRSECKLAVKAKKTGEKVMNIYNTLPKVEQRAYAL